MFYVWDLQAFYLRWRSAMKSMHYCDLILRISINGWSVSSYAHAVGGSHSLKQSILNGNMGSLRRDN